jgi:hypothetical protein
MLRLYGCIFLVMCSTMSIAIPFTINSLEWWGYLLFALDFLALPLWIAETIKSIKLLKIKDDKNDTTN